MSIEDYKSALRRGEREKSALESKGENPYPEVLESLLASPDILKRVKLGIISIPIERIAGTITTNRSNAFSKSFMPLLAPDTEFAQKWAVLYDGMEADGMREPVIAFEYMNKYYIAEGNKRVSVAMNMGMLYVEGTVTRLITAPKDTPESRIYTEYLEFYRKSRMTEIYFSKEGSFPKFAKLISESDDEWSEDTVIDVKSLYARFKREYLALGGEDKLPLSVSDALLTYVSLFGYEDVRNKTGTEIRSDLTKARQEFMVYPDTVSPSISPQPTTDRPIKISNILFGLTPKSMKVAFMHLSDVEKSTWVYAHELGRHYIEQESFPGIITTESFYNVTADMAEEKLEELCAAGFDLIFATSPMHNAACAKIAILHPEVKILNCSLNASTKHLRTYYLRTYESKYLLGMIAGAMTCTGRISYVADYPLYGTIASINAFAAGARSVNSTAEVYLTWTTAKNTNPDADIYNSGCDIVSNLDWSSPKKLTRKFGLYYQGEEPTHLAAPIWNWGKLYEAIIKSIQCGSWQIEGSAVDKGSLGIGYWWGLSSEAVDIIYSKNVPPLTLRLVEFMKEQIIKGSFDPFGGELYFQDGTALSHGSGYDYTDLINMDKLVSNVHGFIPGINEINEENVELTMIQGVKKE